MAVLIQPLEIQEANAQSDTEALLETDLTEKPLLGPPHRSRFRTLPFTPRTIASSIGNVALNLLPSFIVRRKKAEEKKSTPKIQSLDGLRGLACLIVANQHFTYNFTEAIFLGYGVDASNRWFAQRPGVSLLWHGGTMVAIFFVISGYVLSSKPLRLMRAQAWTPMQQTLASSVFRRVIRLYLPVMASTAMIAVLSYLGMYDSARVVKQQVGILTGNEPCPDKFLTITAQLGQWWYFLLSQMREPYTFPNELDMHTWTIPVEVWGSMGLFLAVIGVSRLRPRYRLAVLVGLLIFVVWQGWVSISLFLAGMLLADLDQTIGTPGLAETRIIHFPAALGGIFLASSPVTHAESTPGYILLTSLSPPSWSPPPWGGTGLFWASVGSVILVWVAKRCSLQFLFTNAFVQYLGHISFALYLTHGPVIRSLGYVVMPRAYAVAGGRDTIRGFCGGWLLTALAVWPVIFWAADVFWRCVDAPSVAFGQWLESRLVLTLETPVAGVEDGGGAVSRDLVVVVDRSAGAEGSAGERGHGGGV